MRQLIAKPKVSDLFGQGGRRWLSALELPICERETLDSALRQIDFLDAEVAEAGARPRRATPWSRRPGRWCCSPGPIRAFYERIRARRGHQVAIVAVARKLARLFWCLLTRGEDYAYAQPSLTRKKLRRLELLAGAPRGEVERGIWSTNAAMRKAERALAAQAEVAYKRTVADWQRGQRKRSAGATPGRASSAARQGSAPEPAL